MRSKEFLIEYYQRLDEIAMSPKRLRKMADGIGALVGIEFEMVVPDMGDSDEMDQEPDYNQDQKIRRYSDIREFFHDGDYNGRREVDRLMNEIWENYQDSDWLSERSQEEWEKTKEDYIRDWVAINHSKEFEDQAYEETNKAAGDFGTNSEEFQTAYEERLTELINNKVEDILANGGDEYDEAFDLWFQEEWPEIYNDDDTINDWLESENIEYMSDIPHHYSIVWPYYTTINNGVRLEEIADDFSSAVGMPVDWSETYHGGKRRPGHYTVEPDGSIRGDHGEKGLEFISPPLPIGDMLSDLEDVKRWANKVGAYTNDSTGLHINVSVPDWQGEPGKLDYVKLAVLLGDEHVLRSFGRQGNTYTKSAFDIIKQKIRQNPDAVEQVLAKMKNHLNSQAARAIHDGFTDKYTSIHPKGGYIEFRSPGGDWLDTNFKEIENTLLRFVVALDAAVHEDKYKEEYAKKLYKLLAPSNDETDTLKYFTRYSAGELPKSALASFVRQAQLQRKFKKGPVGVRYWWHVGRPDSAAGVEVVASSREEAIEKGRAEYAEWKYAKDITATPLRPYDTAPVKATVGEPRPAGDVVPGSTVDIQRSRLAAQMPRVEHYDGNWEIYSVASGNAVYRFIANTKQEAERAFGIWQAAIRNPSLPESGFGLRPVRRASERS